MSAETLLLDQMLKRVDSVEASVSERFDRIEGKVDDLTKVLIQVARFEEREKNHIEFQRKISETVKRLGARVGTLEEAQPLQEHGVRWFLYTVFMAAGAFVTMLIGKFFGGGGNVP